MQREMKHIYDQIEFFFLVCLLLFVHGVSLVVVGWLNLLLIFKNICLICKIIEWLSLEGNLKIMQFQIPAMGGDASH